MALAKYWNGSAWVIPQLKVYDGSNWVDVGGLQIESREITTATITSGYSVDVDITAVDLDRSIVRISTTESTPTNQPANLFYGKAQFLDSDTVRITRGTGTGTSYFLIQVLQFKQVGSVQYVEVTLVDGNAQGTVSTVDPSHTICFMSHTSGLTGVSSVQHFAYIENSTTVNVRGNSGSGTAGVFVVDFKGV